MKISFWEDTYKNDDIFTFGFEPNKTLIDFEYLFKNDWNILDAGCGDGKNSLYLASKGFNNIDAFDFSENAIEKLRRLQKKNDCKFNTQIEDLRKFKFEKEYGLIFSFGTLHFVSKDDRNKFILQAKDHTAIGGLNIIQLFTDAIPATVDIAPFAIGLACEGEIKKLYHDWKIVQFKSYTFEEEHPNVPKHLHSSNKIVAQRIK